MDTPQHFYVVVKAGVSSPVSYTFADLAEAEKSARALAEANQGETYVVMEPKQAFRAPKPRAEVVWLVWQSATVAPADNLYGALPDLRADEVTF